MRILVTGGAGFIGSALTRQALDGGHEVLNIDKLTYAGNFASIAELNRNGRYSFLQADVADIAAMNAAFSDFRPEAVIHLAAESHVDRSIDAPAEFLSTNVFGTFIMLEAARRHFDKLDLSSKAAFRFLHVSTDEVFGSLGDEGKFSPESRYAPRSPYAASKASADHLARVWHITYGLPVIVTNCSNNYGPRQHAEKLIPTILRHALADAPIPIYGQGLQRRDWLYVEDHARGLLLALQQGRPGGVYLFGGNTDVSNIHLSREVCATLDRCQPRADGRPYAEQITFVHDRPGHDFRYAIDVTATKSELGWVASTKLADGIESTVQWYLANDDYLVPVEQLGRLGRLAERSGAPEI